MRIKAYTSYDERNKSKYYRNFDVVESLPDFEKVKEVAIDIENNSDAFKYYYFECIDESGFTNYYAISKYLDKNPSIKGYSSNIEIFVDDPNYLTGENNRTNYSFSTDGLSFDDKDELDEYIFDSIITKIRDDVLLSEQDEKEIYEKCEIILDSKITD